MQDKASGMPLQHRASESILEQSSYIYLYIQYLGDSDSVQGPLLFWHNQLTCNKTAVVCFDLPEYSG